MRLFISYKREDEFFARDLARKLRQWGYTPWLDVEQISLGEYWSKEIDQGLKTADLVLGLLTPESIASDNVLNEWAWALSNGKPLIPIKLREVPAADFPHQFIRVQYLDFTRNQEAAFERLKSRLANPATLYHYPGDSLPSTSTRTEEPNDDRGRMLRKVQTIWIEGILNNVLRENLSFELRLEIAPNVVLQHRDYGRYVLPQSGTIEQVFNDMNCRLLILGMPGSGKTILLLQLAMLLIQRAQHDKSYPIPVVFNLSSWAHKREQIADWLLDRLNYEYQVPKKIGKKWVDNGEILLLLDGLDEVREEYRETCVERINEFRRTHSFVNLAVCSRTADYNALITKLDLAGAVVLQPLTSAQIDHYLSGEELAGLRTVIQTDSELQQMAQTPFLLNTMIFVYQGMSATAISGLSSTETRIDHLFEQYIQRRFKQHETPYSQKQVRHWLSWLANAMTERSKTSFYIEELQPDWITAGNQYNTYVLIAGLALGLLVGIVLSIANGLPMGFIVGLTVIISFFVTQGPLFALFMGAAVGISFGIPGRQNVWLPATNYGLSGGLIGAFAFAVIFALVFHFANITVNRNRIVSVEAFGWSWSKALRGLAAGVGLGLFALLVTTPLAGPAIALNNGVIMTLFAGVMMAVFLGLSRRRVEIKTIPNQGIWWSAQHAVFLSLALALPSAIIATLILSVVDRTGAGLATAISLGLSICLAGLFSGGIAVIQHLALRFVLYRSGSIPLNYARFLDYAASCFFMRKVGGGYIFVHRFLLDYFALRN